VIPNLTFAIPTFNRSKYLKELLPEVVNQYLSRAPGTLEIVVIDNASTDDTEDYIRTNFNQHIRYIRNKENIGGDRNFIECIKNANGKYVWLFGDDEILNPGGIHRVMDAIEKDPITEMYLKCFTIKLT
jgi:glycosyltransferase involved in cell wall biosynthesis